LTQIVFFASLISFSHTNWQCHDKLEPNCAGWDVLDR